jgi:hypothetical protein
MAPTLTNRDERQVILGKLLVDRSAAFSRCCRAQPVEIDGSRCTADSPSSGDEDAFCPSLLLEDKKSR